MTNDSVQGTYPVTDPDEMSQEDQARLLVEPSFDHRIEYEADLLRAEFGSPDDGGWYGRSGAYDDARAEYAGGSVE